MGNASFTASTMTTSPVNNKKFYCPKRIFLVRHGESEGNVNESAYCSIPDWKIPLTEKGYSQAKEAGRKIKKIVGDAPLYLYCSPYLRTKQTLHAMNFGECSNIIGAKEEPQLTEQQFGNYQRTADMESYKKERRNFGIFYYRFPQGESGLDVYNRVTALIDR